MSIPVEAVTVPAVVRGLAGGAELVPVWQNEAGGLTFRTGDRYIKWAPRNDETSIAAEVVRLRWAAPHITVPRVLEHGGDATHEWLVTAALPGESAVAPRWVAAAAAAARAVGGACAPCTTPCRSRAARSRGRCPTGSRMRPAAASVFPMRCASRPRSTGWSSATATPAAPTP